MVFAKPPTIPQRIQKELDAMTKASKRILASKKSASAFLSTVRVHPRAGRRQAAKS